MKPETFQRKSAAARRIKRFEMSSSATAETLPPLEHGCEIIMLNGGQIDVINVLDYYVEQTGPAHVLVSTWTAAGADMDFANALFLNGKIQSLRFVTDYSFQSRQPEYCAAMRERFGDSCIRVTKSHAKFCLIENDEWSLAIRTSANLNQNTRVELFEISDDPQMAAFFHRVVDPLWEDHADGEQFAKTPYQNCKDFERFANGGQGDPSDQAAVTDKKYFGTGPSDTDLRRCGMTTSRGEHIK